MAWRAYPREVRAVTMMAELAAQSGDLSATGYLARWKLETEPGWMPRFRQIATDTLRGMGYSADDITVMLRGHGRGSLIYALEAEVVGYGEGALREWIDAHLDDPLLRSWIATRAGPLTAAQKLVDKASQIVYAVKTVADCETAAGKLMDIINELGDDREAVVQVEGYGEMLAMTARAFQEL